MEGSGRLPFSSAGFEERSNRNAPTVASLDPAHEQPEDECHADGGPQGCARAGIKTHRDDWDETKAGEDDW